MDAHRFDAVARRAGTASRRQALRLLAGAALGGRLALGGRRSAVAAAPRITSGPAVPAKTATGATIRWATDVLANSQVRYGPTAAYGQSKTDDALVAAHRLTIAGLSPSTLYHYKAISINQDGRAASADHQFRTCPRARPRYCRTACATPDDPLSTACCVDPQTDERHCGGCGAACAVGRVCCAGACVDPQTDAAHCGGCGAPCPAGARCCEGRCAACPFGGVCVGDRCACPAGTAACGGVCRRCTGGRVLNGFTCRCVCPDGTEPDLLRDERNCGTCGHACPTGPSSNNTCFDGTCCRPDGTICACAPAGSACNAGTCCRNPPHTCTAAGSCP